MQCPVVVVQVIGFDMGGTSTDVSRYAGVYEHVFETTTAGVTIQVGRSRQGLGCPRRALLAVHCDIATATTA
jgi:hypothetical protein